MRRNFLYTLIIVAIFFASCSRNEENRDMDFQLVENPKCFDGVQNQGETSIDCGGPCACATCYDTVLNGNEVGIDCGGDDCFSCNNGNWPKLINIYEANFLSIYGNATIDSGQLDSVRYSQKDNRHVYTAYYFSGRFAVEVSLPQPITGSWRVSSTDFRTSGIKAVERETEFYEAKHPIEVASVNTYFNGKYTVIEIYNIATFGVKTKRIVMRL